MMGDLMSTNNLSAHLSLNGFLAPAIRPPTVPEGQGRIRLSITHEVAQRGLNQLLTVLNQYPIKSKSEDHLVQI
jgi:8-amino-7-oxononanoate synthase